MKKTQIRQNDFPQVALGKSFCIGHIMRKHKDQNLGLYAFNLYCIQSNLPVSLQTSQSKGPHLQKHLFKLRILLLSVKSKWWWVLFSLEQV